MIQTSFQTIGRTHTVTLEHCFSPPPKMLIPAKDIATTPPITSRFHPIAITKIAETISKLINAKRKINAVFITAIASTAAGRNSPSLLQPFLIIRLRTVFPIQINERRKIWKNRITCGEQLE
jgi:hypothetical protein